MSAHLSDEQLAQLRATAGVLLPGSDDSPAPIDITNYEELLRLAALASGGGGRELIAAIGALPAEISWESLSMLADSDPAALDEVALVAVGAYYMSEAVQASLGLPTGDRRPADREQVVNELESGILDPVFERGCPVRTLEEIDERSRS